MNISVIEAKEISHDKKLKVAAYCRVSTEFSDQLESLETQKAHYETMIRRNPSWEYAGLYYDAGLSGVKTAGRDGLQKLLADCHTGKIDRILTKSISRFSRNTVDILEIVRILLDMNISIYFEKENVDSSAMDGEMLLTILGSIAENESVSISQNVKWSIKKKFRSGTFKASYLPLGYTKDEHGDMVIQPEEAEIVRWIFESAINGSSTHKIAKMLREKNVPTRKGGMWSASTVRDIITNEKYMGDALFQKTYTDESFHRHTNKGEVEKTLVQGHHEPIVSKETFDKANAVMMQRSSEKGIVRGTDKYQARYAFSGKIICGECGGTFKRRIHDHGSEIAWTCRTHIDDIQKCSMKFVSDKFIKAAFVTMLNKLIFAHKLVLLPYIEELKRKGKSDHFDDVQRLQENLQKNTSQRDNLRLLRAKGIIDAAAYGKENNFLKKQAEELRMEIARISYANMHASETVKEAEKLLKFVQESQMMMVYSDELFTAFVEHIVVFERKCIGFEMKCGLMLKEVLE
ncbi:MAG: recombinase family protein [Ruminococcus flavefaciens]|nr:recombinase family protein [Ruminococcus flavefaciens]MCM1061080.1 recombinase family protein [Eubacterium sp.]